MSDSIKLSPKYGVNPTIPVCFFCGKPKNEVALLGKMGGKGEDIEAPMHMVIDYEPCDECKANMDMGITIMGVVTKNPDNRPTTGSPRIFLRLSRAEAVTSVRVPMWDIGIARDSSRWIACACSTSVSSPFTSRI